MNIRALGASTPVAALAIAVTMLAGWTTAVGDHTVRNRGASAASSRVAAVTEDPELRDASVTAQVKSKLATNANTRDLRIDVDTRNGVVRLRGEVESATERDLAELLARNTEAVAMVQNDLIVRGRGMAGR